MKSQPTVNEGKPKLTGRFGIVLPRSREVILFGKRRLWAKKEDAEFHLRHSRGYWPYSKHSSRAIKRRSKASPLTGWRALGW